MSSTTVENLGFINYLESSDVVISISKLEKLQEEVIAMREALKHMVPGYNKNWREQMDIDKAQRKRKREDDVSVKEKRSKMERNKQTTKIKDGDCVCEKDE